jgi:hypothetical protein
MPWLVPVAAMVVGLRWLGVPGAAVAAYGAYFVGCVVLPGVLLMRALWRTTGNWAEDAGLGAACGLAYELAGWALFTAFGWQRWLVVWPLLALLCFAAVPRLRRCWRIEDPKPLPVAWAWGVALVATVSLATSAIWAMGPHVPPPDGVSYYPDLLYHLSMLHELVRQVPPELPQVAGEHLDYHWFPDAHLAAASDITGVSPSIVLFRLWMMPIWLAGLVIFAALARMVSRAWWAGVLAVVMTGFAQYIVIWSMRSGRMNTPFNFLSPSQTIAVVVTVAAAVVLLDLLFRRLDGHRAPSSAWIVLVALGIVAGGSKPTALPLLLGGTGLAALWMLLRGRRVPWRPVGAGILLLATGVLTMLTVTGSTGGSRLQMFALTKGVLGYGAATGDRSPRGMAGTWVVEAMALGDRIAVLAAWVLVATVFVSQLGMLIGFGLLAARSTRQDPVAWWLAGAMLAGWLGFLLISHPSGSEAYFLNTAAPFGAAAASWLAVASLRGRSRRTVLRVGAVGAGLGIALAALPQVVRVTEQGTRQDRLALLGYPMLVLLGTSLAALAGWRLLRRRRPTLAGLGWALVVATVIGMTLPYAGYTIGRIVVSGNYPGSPIRRVEYAVSPDEQRAAVWLNTHSEPTDVVVTNTACRPARRQPPGCDARGYIVSAIAGRRTLLEGWGYTEQAQRRHGVGGLPYTSQPSPWPDRARLTNEVFTKPTAALLARLRDEYGVRWVYADLLAGPVPDGLAAVAVLHHTEQTVRIYEVVAGAAGSNAEG